MTCVVLSAKKALRTSAPDWNSLLKFKTLVVGTNLGTVPTCTIFIRGILWRACETMTLNACGTIRATCITRNNTSTRRCHIPTQELLSVSSLTSVWAGIYGNVIQLSESVRPFCPHRDADLHW